VVKEFPVKSKLLILSPSFWLLLSFMLTSCSGLTPQSPRAGDATDSPLPTLGGAPSTTATASTSFGNTPSATAPGVTASPTASFELWASSSQPDEKLIKSAVKPFLQAMGLKDAEVTLKSELINGVNGPFAVMVDPVTGTPLFIAGPDRKWEAVTPKNLADAIGFILSVPLGGYGSLADYANLVKFQTGNFNAGMVYFGSQNWTGENEANLTAPSSDAKIGQTAGMQNILAMNVLWANDVPEWLKNGTYSTEQMKQIIQNYLKQTVGAFNSIVNAWVVVNEFNFADGGVDIFKESLGDEYVDYAFAQARALDNKATLIYNDYDNETVDKNRYAITRQVIDRLKSNDPNIGVGIEMHLLWNSVPDSNQVIEAMKSYGVPVYVTEFDVKMDGFQGTSAEKEKAQAEIYQKMIAAAVRSEVVRQFNIFGLVDRLSVWEAPGRFGGSIDADPLILHDDFSPKQSYYGMLAGILEGAQAGGS
jgi:GH35 family endo-1,4-beta-xylanase